MGKAASLRLQSNEQKSQRGENGVTLSELAVLSGQPFVKEDICGKYQRTEDRGQKIEDR